MATTRTTPTEYEYSCPYDDDDDYYCYYCCDVQRRGKKQIPGISMFMVLVWFHESVSVRLRCDFLRCMIVLDVVSYRLLTRTVVAAITTLDPCKTTAFYTPQQSFLLCYDFVWFMICLWFSWKCTIWIRSGYDLDTILIRFRYEFNTFLHHSMRLQLICVCSVCAMVFGLAAELLSEPCIPA